MSRRSERGRFSHKEHKEHKGLQEGDTKMKMGRILAAVVSVAMATGAMLGARAAEKLYCVIDLSGGPDSTSYPVSYVSSVPSGGWNDEYKTTKLVLRRIEPGTFMMCGTVETTITKPFYIGVFEVTQKQYELVMGSNPSAYNGDARPVEQVSYNDIRGSSDGAGWPESSAVDENSFLGKMVSRTGLSLDLPTEAQWEYACRAGTTSTYNNGGSTEDDLKTLGRYSGNTSDGRGGYSQHTTVGSYAPNAWGLYDMHGNVWEWCLDWHGTLAGGNDPKGATSGSGRVQRGGSWLHDAASCTSSYRNGDDPSDGIGIFGFRLCCSAGLAPNVALGFEEYARGALTEEDCPALIGNETVTLTIAPINGSMGNIDAFTPPFTSAGTNCLSIKTTLGNPCAFTLKGDKSSVEVSSEHPYYVDFLARFTSFEETPGGVAPYAAQTSGRAMLQGVGISGIDSFIIHLRSCGFVCYIDDDIMLWSHEELDFNDEPVSTNWWVRAGNGSGGTVDYMLTSMGDDSSLEGNGDWYRVTFKACRDEVSGKLFFNIFLNGKQVRAGEVTDFSSMTDRTSLATVRFDGQGCVDNIVSYETPPVCIRNVTAKQRWPWNGKVDLTYEVVGDIAAGLPEGAYAQLVVTATNRADGAIYVAAADALSGDIGSAVGRHQVVWDLSAQGLGFRSDDVVFTVGYEKQRCPYCVIDLSGGASASSYPVSYLTDIPSGGWTDEYKTTKLLLKLIGPGSFKMCDTKNVTLTKPFYCGVFEVTQKQYELVTGTNPSYFTGNTLPVESVSWNTIRGVSSTYNWPGSSDVDSNSFMGKIQARTGLNFDLPTEAQWEYACRAGTTTRYPWGESFDEDYCWCSTNAAGTTHVVGTRSPNSWGLYDMCGNVREWSLDWYGDLSSGVTDPVGAQTGTLRVRRGGSWNVGEEMCKSNYRNHDYPGNALNSYGFRLFWALAEVTSNVGLCLSDSSPISVDLIGGPRASIGSEMLTYSSMWDGDENATVTIAQNGVSLAEGLTGEDTYSWNAQKTGTYILTHTTYMNGVAGKVESATFNVAAKDIALAQVEVDCSDVAYRGAAYEPAIQSVIWGEKVLVEGTDYTLVYSGNVDAGTATITLTGSNLYGGTYTTNFTIRPKMLTEGMVEAIGNHPYTGKAQTPKPTVTDTERVVTLSEGVEYTLSYANNTAIGEGIVTVTGKGNYTGSIARAFVIEPSEGSELEERLGGAGKVESDGEGGWIVTITNDVDAASLPIEIPDDFGNVTLDLNGHDLVGPNGEPVIRIVPGHDEGGPTQLTIVTSGGDAIVQGGEGAPAVEVTEGAQDGVIINIGEGVTVQGGGVPAIDGTIGENDGNLVKVEVPVPTIASKEYTGG